MIIVLLLGGELAGLFGVLLAIPVAGAIKVILPDVANIYKRSPYFRGHAMPDPLFEAVMLHDMEDEFGRDRQRADDVPVVTAEVDVSVEDASVEAEDDERAAQPVSELPALSQPQTAPDPAPTATKKAASPQALQAPADISDKPEGEDDQGDAS